MTLINLPAYANTKGNVPNMFEKLGLKRKIAKYKKNIAELEQKRSRSQAALVEAILTHTTPNDDDVDYFNHFTGLINAERDKMHVAMKELEELEKK